MNGVRGDEALLPRSRADIEAIASAFRRTLGLGGVLRIDGTSLFERLDELVIQHGGKEIPVDYKVAAAMDWGVEACSRYDAAASKFDVVLLEETYKSLHDGHPRALFTLCHECGHIVLHTEDLIRRALTPANSMNRRKTHPIYRDTEWQSDCFAAAFIAPATAILRVHDRFGFTTSLDIAREFGMSKSAAAYRLDELAKVLPEGRLQILR